ncbi:hypothetical protein D3C87_1621900 [compost metagenome]
METNYIVEGIIIVLVIVLVIFLISRNRKDQKKYEKEIIESEIKPGKHDDEHQ